MNLRSDSLNRVESPVTGLVLPIGFSPISCAGYSVGNRFSISQDGHSKKNIARTHDWLRPPKAVKQSDHSRAERDGAKESSMEYFNAMNRG